MRLFRRNALGLYAVYGAAVLSGLIVTPITLHAIGKGEFGVWKFIGGITIYVSLLDLGVGPSIVRFAAEARGRGSTEDVNALASVGLAIYAVIGLATIPLGLVSWFVPALMHMPAHLEWPARISAFLVVHVAGGAIPAGALLQPARGPAALRRPEPRESRLDAALRGPGRRDSAARRRPDLPRCGHARDEVIRLGIPLAWLRSSSRISHCGAATSRGRARGSCCSSASATS